MSIEEGDAKAREFNVMFIETSAKAGFNIKVRLYMSKGGQGSCSVTGTHQLGGQKCSRQQLWHCHLSLIAASQ